MSSGWRWVDRYDDSMFWVCKNGGVKYGKKGFVCVCFWCWRL